jgi:tRNA modification GTPase
VEASPKPPPSRGDTIAAIATAAGRGGIGVVRISGPAVDAIARGILGALPPPRHARLARFRAGDGSVIDQGIALRFAAPRSMTGEDVLELQGHGGPVVLQLLLGRCLELGARLAEPGEFSRRAFLNDRIDLAQAEAVADLIEASTAAAARSAMRSLCGAFSGEVRALTDALISLRALVEATLDFPEEDQEFLQAGDARGRLERLGAGLAALTGRARQGSLLREGLHVVLAGAPNVGKSSLLNRLAGEERAIVTELAGTTRDALRETIQIEGIPLHVIDTAGLRETEDRIERLGIGRTWREIERADLVLQMMDARSGQTAQDEAIAARLPAGVERLRIFNKVDLAAAPARRTRDGSGVALWLSAATGAGIDLLHAELLRVAGWQPGREDSFLARERHLQALAAAQAHVECAATNLARLEICAEELRLAQEALGRILGEFTPDDLLGEIFSRFCIGK